MEDAAALEQAARLLAPAQNVLDRFNYKHKNQHRLSKWWADFDMLRRHAAKLARDHISPAVDGIRDGQARKKRRKASGKQAPEQDDLAALVLAKAKWLHEYLIPRVYLGFTQLAADNQFAQLGLLLLGVLAQIHAATVPLLPPAPSTPQVASPCAVDGVRASSPPPQQQTTQPPSRSAAGSLITSASDDVGVAVSRDEIVLTGDPSRRKEEPLQDGSDVPAAVSRVSSEETARPKKRMDMDKEKAATAKVLQPAGDGQDSAAKDISAAPRRDKTRIEKSEKKDKAKKKKRKRAGDEFDDLFGSLM